MRACEWKVRFELRLFLFVFWSEIRRSLHEVSTGVFSRSSNTVTGQLISAAPVVFNTPLGWTAGA